MVMRDKFPIGLLSISNIDTVRFGQFWERVSRNLQLSYRKWKATCKRSIN